MLIISKENQVVTVRNSTTREVASSLRINGKSYLPKVLSSGMYTIEIGEGNTPKRFYTVKAEHKNGQKLKVQL